MEKNRDEIDLALEYFGIKADKNDVTSEEVEAKFASMTGSYSLEDDVLEDIKLSNHYLSVLTHHINKREYANMLKDFKVTYQSEIQKNVLGKTYLEDMKKRGKTSFSREEIAERLLDKKFAHQFLTELQSCGYNMVVQYGSLDKNKNNTEPPMSSKHSRMAAVLLYSDNEKLPPLVVELGNRTGGIKIGETTISAREGAKKVANCTVFKMLNNPSQEKILFIGSQSGTVGKVPQHLNNKHFSVDNLTSAKVQEAMERALSTAIRTMPEDMKDIAQQRAAVIKDNSKQYAYARDLENLPDWASPSNIDRQEKAKLSEPQSPKSNPHQ